MFKSITPFLIIVVLVMMVPRVIGLIRGPAETPGIFDQQYTLTQANEIAQESGKPMLVLVTADWCGPCQTLKRSAMVDPAVVAWASAHTVPVYLEHGANPDEISSLPVSAFPTTFLIQDGKVLASLQGAVGAKSLVDQFDAVLAQRP